MHRNQRFDESTLAIRRGRQSFDLGHTRLHDRADRAHVERAASAACAAWQRRRRRPHRRVPRLLPPRRLRLPTAVLACRHPLRYLHLDTSTADPREIARSMFDQMDMPNLRLGMNPPPRHGRRAHVVLGRGLQRRRHSALRHAGARPSGVPPSWSIATPTATRDSTRATLLSHTVSARRTRTP